MQCQWEEKELDTQFTPKVYFWTPNSEILAEALTVTEAEVGLSVVLVGLCVIIQTIILMNGIL